MSPQDVFKRNSWCTDTFCMLTFRIVALFCQEIDLHAYSICFGKRVYLLLTILRTKEPRQMHLFYKKSKSESQTQNSKNTCVCGEKGSPSLGVGAPRWEAFSPTAQTSRCRQLLSHYLLPRPCSPPLCWMPKWESCVGRNADFYLYF